MKGRAWHLSGSAAAVSLLAAIKMVDDDDEYQIVLHGCSLPSLPLPPYFVVNGTKRVPPEGSKSLQYILLGATLCIYSYPSQLSRKELEIYDIVSLPRDIPRDINLVFIVVKPQQKGYCNALLVRYTANDRLKHAS